MIMILSLSDYDVVDSHHERMATHGLPHTTPPGLRTLVLMYGIRIFPDV